MSSMKHKAQKMYKSQGKTVDGNPFISVKKARGYYLYAERGGVDSIAFILFDNKSKKFGLIHESKPPLDERMNKKVHMTTAFGGSIDSLNSKKEICLTEVEEESGFEVTLDRIHEVGTTMVSTQMSQMCTCFLVDVTGLEKTKDAEYEIHLDKFNGNAVKWFTISEVMDNQDWKSVYIVMQSIYKEIISNT